MVVFVYPSVVSVKYYCIAHAHGPILYNRLAESEVLYLSVSSHTPATPDKMIPVHAEESYSQSEELPHSTRRYTRRRHRDDYSVVS